MEQPARDDGDRREDDTAGVVYRESGDRICIDPLSHEDLGVLVRAEGYVVETIASAKAHPTNAIAPPSTSNP